MQLSNMQFTYSNKATDNHIGYGYSDDMKNAYTAKYDKYTL